MGRILMADYELEGPKPARMYEVILPKKLNYFGKIQQVLEDLFEEDVIRTVPDVRRSIAEYRRRDPNFDEEAWVKSLGRATRGYSIYEMDGRYLGPAGPIDERVLVIRFIFHNPIEAEFDEADANSTPPGTDLLTTSLAVVNHLVAYRFAVELGVEEEIWFLEYPQTKLAIWRKRPALSPGDQPRPGDGPHDDENRRNRQ